MRKPIQMYRQESGHSTLRNQFVSQGGFACRVDPINGNPQRMWMDTRDQDACQLMEGLLSCHHCSSLP
ncbi:MAG: hypothetical protein ACJ8CB_08175 [Ktedonobacteraceae bacterium]